VDASHTPLADERRKALEAILESKTFRASDGQRAFLRYVGERAIAGSTDLIKEYSIGVEVFERGESFDPRLDPIVRVMARKLRAGLARYYAVEGKLDPVVVELPKGSYVPLFLKRSALDAVVPLASVSAGVPLPHAIELARPRIRWVVAAAGSAMAVLTAAVLYLFQANSQGANSTLLATVAVLPLVTTTDDQEESYLADGLTEELIDSLDRIPGLRVAGRASAFRFKGQPHKLREVGEKLKVHTLLEGMIRKSAGRVHLAVQLVNAVNGYKLWAETYDRAANELPAIEREVVQSVINALGVPLGDEARYPVQVAASPKAEAYQDYLTGRHFWSQLSVESLESAIRYFERAIAKDPSYASAYAGLADCYAMIPQLTDARTPEMSARIRSAASRALRLDSTLGEAHIALAMASAYEYDWPAAEQEYRIGLALNPGNPVAHLWFGGYLTLLGRVDEALVQRSMAAELDPLSLYAQEALARTYYHARRYDDAIRQYKLVLGMESNFGLVHQGLGRVYLQKGMFQEAIVELLTASRLLGSTPRSKAVLAYAYARSGRQAEARQILNEFLEASRRGKFPAVVIAEVYLGLGEQDLALQWLERVVDQKDLFSRADPLYDPIRSNPRFTGLLRRINL
jgi:TolB-like protein/Tfp pilus assembly protein PilF